MKNTKLKLFSTHEYKTEFEKELEDFMATDPDIISIHFSTTTRNEFTHGEDVIFSALVQYK